MSHCVVPNWNLRQQRQDPEEVEVLEPEEEEQCRSSSDLQNHHLQNLSHFVSMSKEAEVAELTWENGQLSMNGFSGLLPPPPTKPAWERAGETLESIVHQATTTMPHKQVNQDNQFSQFLDPGPATMISHVPAAAGKWSKKSGVGRIAVSGSTGKRTRHVGAAVSEEIGAGAGASAVASASASASASATFCRENENNTLMTWGPSFETPGSLNFMSSRRTTKSILDHDDSACLGDSENRDEINQYYQEEHQRQQLQETKEEISGRSHSNNRRSRAASVHNLSERRRRDRINQKMKALQKLVPNASKTDKASMLDEVIDYLKQLQGQVHMMNVVRNNMSQMMMSPMGMQQQMQMSLLARMGMGGVGLGMGMGMGSMGMGMGMGMGGIMDINTMAAAAAAASSRPVQHPPPHASLMLSPPMIPMQYQAQPQPQPQPPAPSQAQAAGQDHGPTTRGAFPDPYAAFLAQSMNMELYNKMATLYREQTNQGIKQQNMCSSSPSSHVQRE